MSRNPPLSLTRISAPIRVAVVSDDPIARAGLEAALHEADGVELPPMGGVAEVVLWDAGNDPAGPSLSITAAGALAELDVPAVVVIAQPAHADAALAAGARGVVLRDQIGPSLLAALSAVRQGLTVLDTELAPRPTASRPATLAEPLTPREQEVLGHMTSGLSNKLIAAELGISEHTAKFHVNSILLKLDADTRTEAVVKAVRLGLITL